MSLIPPNPSYLQRPRALCCQELEAPAATELAQLRDCPTELCCSGLFQLRPRMQISTSVSTKHSPTQDICVTEYVIGEDLTLTTRGHAIGHSHCWSQAWPLAMCPALIFPSFTPSSQPPAQLPTASSPFLHEKLTISLSFLFLRNTVSLCCPGWT